jgi:divalent metal cation (Fe/Co/Zn/Cd) transporter
MIYLVNPEILSNALKMASDSKTAIFAAILGNVAIAVTKFIVATLTGSSAMLSEAIHSVVDTSSRAWTALHQW